MTWFYLGLVTDLGWLLNCRCWIFGVGPPSLLLYQERHSILSWLTVSACIIHNPILSPDIILMSSYAECLWACQLCGIESLHLPGHHVMAAMLSNMIKCTSCISTFHIPWGCPTKTLCVILFSFFFVTSSTTISLPDLFTKTLKIYWGYHTVY